MWSCKDDTATGGVTCKSGFSLGPTGDADAGKCIACTVVNAATCPFANKAFAVDTCKAGFGRKRLDGGPAADK